VKKYSFYKLKTTTFDSRKNSRYEVWGFHGGEDSNHSLLVYDAV